MRLKRILIPAFCLAGTALIVLPLVHAAGGGNFGLDTAATGAGLKNPNLPVFIGGLIQKILSYLGILFLILMLYAGFLYMTAQGDDKKIGQAKSIIGGAVIGLVIIAASYALTSFVLSAVSGTTGASNTGNTSNTSNTQTTTPGSVPAGGACTSGADCQGLLECTGGKCVSPL